ncbi:MAG: hypothetical protein ISN28_01855 [Ectothiorhodospiraceae bacterium AqS1]|nr:hypothetical protein [Ectothiorhodospiraceae bacterium AqS1]
MSGNILILLGLFLIVAVGAIVLVYYRRIRGRNSLFDAPSASQDSTASDHDVADLPEKDALPLSEPQLRDETRNNPAFDESVGQGAASLSDHTNNVSAGESDPKIEPEYREDDGRIPEGDSIDDSQAKVEVGSGSGERRERVIDSGHESESTDSQSEIETASAPDIAGMTKEETPDVEADSVVSSTEEADPHQSEAQILARSANPMPSTEAEESIGEDAVRQPKADDDSLAVGVRNEQVGEPEPAVSSINNEDAIPREVPADSIEQVAASEGLDESQPTIEEYPSVSTGENLDLVDRSVSDTEESESNQSEAHILARSVDSASGAEIEEAVGEDAVRQPKVDDDYLPVRIRDEHVREPEPAGSSIDDEDAIPREIPADSIEQVSASEGLDKNQPAIEERPSVTTGESLGLVDRDASTPDIAPDMLADDEGSYAAEGYRADEVPDVSHEEKGSTEFFDDLRDEEPPKKVIDDGDFDSDEKPGDPDVDLATISRSPQEKQFDRKKPRKYKGLVRDAPRPRDTTPTLSSPKSEEPVQRKRALSIEVRLKFERDGYCSVSLIPKKSANLPEDLTVSSPAGDITLREMQDDWYQDVFPEDISSVLREGVAWTYDDGQISWSLSGRFLYVLAEHTDISGYVSQPCLRLGRTHVILCHESLKAQVECAIQQTGAQSNVTLDESLGAPPGWIVFRDVVPKISVSPSGDKILNPLRPPSNIEISLERGIGLGYPKWLHGYPPSIRVYGDPEHIDEVLIDFQVATRNSDGTYSALDWNSIGPHKIWCSGKSKSYSILPFDMSWDLWEGCTAPIAPGETRNLTICGPIVQTSSNETDNRAVTIPVPDTNPILIGANPGQIVEATKVSAQYGFPRLASSSFRPIWALPRDALHCDKEVTRIVLVAGADQAEVCKKVDARWEVDNSVDVDSWCRIIRNASRKGMRTEPDTKPVRRLWNSYKGVAKRLRRSRR